MDGMTARPWRAPGLLCAAAGATERDAGLASGINTAAFQLGGALGVAVATSVVRTGFRAVFDVSAGIALAGAVVAGLLLMAAGRRRVSESEKVRVP